MQLAAREGRVAMVEWLVRQGLSLEYSDPTRNLVLIAATHERLNLLKWLEEKGLSLDVRDQNGNDPVLLASANRDVLMLEWLVLEKELPLDSQNDQKLTALNHAVGKKYSNDFDNRHLATVLFIVDKLLRQGINLDCEGWSLLSWKMRASWLRSLAHQLNQDGFYEQAEIIYDIIWKKLETGEEKEKLGYQLASLILAGSSEQQEKIKIQKVLRTKNEKAASKSTMEEALSLDEDETNKPPKTQEEAFASLLSEENLCLFASTLKTEDSVHRTLNEKIALQRRAARALSYIMENKDDASLELKGRLIENLKGNFSLQQAEGKEEKEKTYQPQTPIAAAHFLNNPPSSLSPPNLAEFYRLHLGDQLVQMQRILERNAELEEECRLKSGQQDENNYSGPGLF
ncbi:ankyrin repeat domain-containing T4SS effector AnkA [Coxiella burnetii]|uniref:Ankyrin repeat protein n=1 Tax=Coxiella burnetii (strain RSA 493 / Nine Mile phase I) TaxID=227377 RepID=Q83F76_COXBU|nr:ankyrin repeat domain-containing T4SS effector AnkA [Coxiella burnetii]NP_819125.1 ankyrin repeat-containing protein [Coxiella burnetii RSA 493]AAO89639.1 ankyrin repeat protein [Coxiella burnetii RSA 493]ARI64995.1 hypothetical protein B7L74_00375 [Coxiella burnetii]ARK26498.1 hypothetical protein BMW92_00370 [Coxiella burnetii]ATN73616.1 hypothetical protein AYM90_00350 [Coxiella burnetii]ATN75525.1 hypothetical protein AYM94_00345 [Coxiella burnetii]